MLFVYILLGLLGTIAVVLAVPVYARVIYDGDLRVRLRVLGVPFVLLPREHKTSADKPVKKPVKTKKGKKPALSKWQEIGQMFRQDGPAATLHYLCEIAKLAGQATDRLLRAITVDRLHVEWCIATGDPADTAMRYGQVCGAVYTALAAISGPVRVRRQHLRIEPNFLLEKSDVYLDVKLHVGVYRLLWAALVLLVRFLLINDNNSTINHKEVMQHDK